MSKTKKLDRNANHSVTVHVLDTITVRENRFNRSHTNITIHLQERTTVPPQNLCLYNLNEEQIASLIQALLALQAKREQDRLSHQRNPFAPEEPQPNEPG